MIWKERVIYTCNSALCFANFQNVTYERLWLAILHFRKILENLYSMFESSLFFSLFFFFNLKQIVIFFSLSNLYHVVIKLKLFIKIKYNCNDWKRSNIWENIAPSNIKYYLNVNVGAKCHCQMSSQYAIFHSSKLSWNGRCLTDCSSTDAQTFISEALLAIFILRVKF